MTPTSLLLMYSGCGVQAEVVHGAFPSCFVSSGRARGVGCRQCPGNARSFCRTIAAALISPVPMVCYFNQYQVPSAFTNQGLLYVAMIFVSCGGGPVHKRAVFFQWEKYRYKLTSDPCALASTPFLQIVQLRKNERVDEGQG